MPVSGDEYDTGMLSPNQYQSHPGMSKAEQRKSNKPIMEKRRRARINHCLNELKSLILDALKKDPARHSKLEKADILEMTVKHLQKIQQQQLTIAMATDPTVIQKFKTGFNECATEVSRYIGRMDGIEPCVKQRLVSHLASCVSGLKKMPTFSLPATSSQSVFRTNQQSGTLSEDVNNNNASARLQMMTGVQLIPSRLPSGELALLLPNSQQIPGNMISFFPQSQETNLVTTTSEQVHTSTLSNKTIDRHHFSAFTAVNRQRSPLPSPSSSTASIYCEDSTDQPYPSPSNVHEVSSTSEQEKIKQDYNSTIFRVKPIENLLQISTEPYQSEPVINRPSFSTFMSSSVQKHLLTPLTVITSGTVISTSKTSNNIPDVRFQHPANMKSPVDFSLMKEQDSPLLASKRPYPEDQLDTKPDNRKVLKSSFGGEEKSLDLRYDHTPPESVKPSTSNSDTARDMWRPW